MSSRGQSRSGLRSPGLPFDAGCQTAMPPSPRGPVPRASRSSIVSTWSSALCPSAMASAPASFAMSRRASWRSRRAAISSDSPVRAMASRTCTRRSRNGAPRRRASDRVKSESAGVSASGSVWSTCARTSSTPCGASRRCASSASAVESAPPDTPTATRRSRTSEPMPESVFRTVSGIREGDRLSSEIGSGLDMGRSLNTLPFDCQDMVSPAIYAHVANETPSIWPGVPICVTVFP